MAIKQLWTEQYRPKSVDEYVFRDQQLKNQVQTWIKDKFIPHILLSGSPGTGKSSLARVLINEIGVDPGDILYINASDDRGIETVRQAIQTFVSTIPMGDFKVVLLEEFDQFGILGQGALRRITEDYADSSRFILTANHVNKIIPAIRSRCQEVILQSLDEDAFKLKMAEILVTENVSIDSEEILDTYMKATYPDLRKCINLLQQNTFNGELLAPSENEGSSKDWQLQAVDMFKKGSISEARKTVIANIRSEEYEDFYRLLYRNLDWFSKTEDQSDEALIIIRDSLVKHVSCADAEINLSACLAQLTKVSK